MPIAGFTILTGFPVVQTEFDYGETALCMMIHRCNLLVPTVTGKTAGGRPEEEFSVLEGRIPCQFYAKGIRAREEIKPRELGVGVYTMAFPKAVDVTERWRVLNISDLQGRLIGGVGGKTLEIIGPPTPWDEFGLVVVPVRVAT